MTMSEDAQRAVAAAFDPNRLDDNNNGFNSINITKDHKSLRFSVDSTRYNWNIATEQLTVLGRYRGAQDSTLVKDEEDESRKNARIVVSK